MTFGFPAYHTQHFTPPNPNYDVRILVRQTLDVLNWRLREDTHGYVVASTGVNLLSWGERIIVEFHPDNSCSVTSKCSLPTQCFDWGKNASNVRKFMSHMMT
jgi:hypothetical protein